jgi:hypothetical protein
MSLDVDALVARFTRARQPTPSLAPPSFPAPPAHPGADVMAYNPPSKPQQGGDLTPSPPPRRTSGRGPKRRRWAMPGSPAERRQATVDPPTPELFMCPHCGERHQLIPMHTGGYAALYGRSVVDDPTRPEPIGRANADTTSLVRDLFHPWR